MTPYGAIEILGKMLEHAERVLPWRAEEFMSSLEMSQATAYRHLRMLVATGLVRHVTGGYVLGKPILEAGAKYASNLERLATHDKFEELQEALYG